MSESSDSSDCLVRIKDNRRTLINYGGIKSLNRYLYHHSSLVQVFYAGILAAVAGEDGGKSVANDESMTDSSLAGLLRLLKTPEYSSYSELQKVYPSNTVVDLLQVLNIFICRFFFNMYSYF